MSCFLRYSPGQVIPPNGRSEWINKPCQKKTSGFRAPRYESLPLATTTGEKPGGCPSFWLNWRRPPLTPVVERRSVVSRSPVLSRVQVSAPVQPFSGELRGSGGFPWARLLLHGSTAGVLVVCAMLFFDAGEPDPTSLQFARVVAALVLFAGVLLVHLRFRKPRKTVY